MDCVERMAQNYAIPVVFVSGDKSVLPESTYSQFLSSLFRLLELVEEYDLEPNPRYKVFVTNCLLL